MDGVAHCACCVSLCVVLQVLSRWSYLVHLAGLPGAYKSCCLHHTPNIRTRIQLLTQTNTPEDVYSVFCLFWLINQKICVSLGLWHQQLWHERKLSLNWTLVVSHLLLLIIMFMKCNQWFLKQKGLYFNFSFKKKKKQLFSSSPLRRLSSDQLPLTNRGFEKQVGGASVLTAIALCPFQYR